LNGTKSPLNSILLHSAAPPGSALIRAPAGYASCPGKPAGTPGSLACALRAALTARSLRACHIITSLPSTAGINLRLAIDFLAGDPMDIRAAIKREERKLVKQLGTLQHQLNGVRAAAKALRNSASHPFASKNKPVLSAAARAKIGKAAKKRWAKFRAEAKKLA
jgi:hypothetical protein